MREREKGGEENRKRTRYGRRTGFEKRVPVRYVRASDVRRGSVEKRERKSNEVGDGFDPDGFTPIHAFW